ncbi:MAG TPA: TonB-dependent receptor plug domain-containing protein, partial [Candidatus Acidoferrum sp.]|nr:TonB-dependent receptor plug domain-containing protein [Candidatus Acidoferrum sp.]
MLLSALAFLVCPCGAFAQRERGELRIDVKDPQGRPAAGTAQLVSESNQLKREFPIAADGKYVAAELPFGVYRLTVAAEGFADWTDLVEIRSEVPVRVGVTLGVASINTRVEVTDAATLLDPSETATIYSVSGEKLREHGSAQPGRTLSDVVNDQPGWLYEANGILHPRGSEYQVQYVLDGMPLTQNRSPGFAPSFDAGDIESLRVLTAGYAAEYGRKLGGIVELTTEKNPPAGLHGRVELGGGSFDSIGGAAEIGYSAAANHFEASAMGFHTDRYLDPPVLENFTNWGNGSGFSGSYERDFSEKDRLRFTVTHSETRYAVPNERVQQTAGQRQDVASTETSGQIYFQHIASSNLLWSLSASVRDDSFSLRSNDLSTPVIVSQDRGYREGYLRADISWHRGHNDWKAGVDALITPVHEFLSYQITDPSKFDPGTLLQFSFHGRKWDAEPAFYVQDTFHVGNWSVAAGLRFDHYGFVANESAWSPRIGISRYVPQSKTLLHFSYDRVFQTPAMENLLLASSPELDSLNPVVVRLPVRPSRANYFEGGLTQALFGKFRLDANVFRRNFRNFADDDVLLDTGVSFPIAFDNARIIGEEIRLAVSEWRRFSGFLSYSNQSASAQGPITGGLFLGSEAGDELAETTRFAVTQDQRNTVRARVRAQVTKRVWAAVSANYGSGLPIELDPESIDLNFLLAQYGKEILSRVNLERGRVKPNFSLGAAAGVELYRKEARTLNFQVEAA